ncbi:methylthioribulose 1-phosphate dehydratase [filamentous cyanobacterium LEGE 11480]|uniref:Methylthioribulose-1-phosphate dehydratase n=1 Tax=Romeriopsis navalis LEGE 11480 TaxID=2777977 RepID=A0A928Z3D7_9CYAN|nr:methylthioribulose 1-phosphate dehydratase [Romeriopsis navalis]MBE9029927.1 methylthioribulose 1-phosphate dehydratase [Romeriopsis navalis LEGE 11480]
MTDPRTDLVNAAKYFHQRGWMLGTAGNLSARLEDGSFWITASGKSKGELTENDFIHQLPNGTFEKPRPDLKPSAETSIHEAVYAIFPEARACYHVHSIEANLVSNFTHAAILPLPPLEMIKGFGIWEANPKVGMPLFANHLDVPMIGQAIRDRFTQELPPIPALLIRNHGVTVWGKSPEDARNKIELAEYIFRYMVQAKHLGLCSD